MARKHELAVGQVRELATGKTGAWRNTGVAKCQIEALNQLGETVRRTDAGYTDWVVHEDMILVTVLEPHGWKYDDLSSLMTNRRPRVRVKDKSQDTPSLRYEGERRDNTRDFGRSYSARWKYDELMPDQYLVKARLLGPTWDQQAKDEARVAAERGARRKAAYDAAVRAQDLELSKELELAGVPSSRWSPGAWRLSSNDLARLINQLLQNEAIPEVHWSQFESQD